MDHSYQLGKEIGAILARLEALETKKCRCKEISREPATWPSTETAHAGGEVCSIVLDSGPLASDICSNGSARKVNINGVCYCQICCGGQWYYVKRNDGSFVKCGDGNQLFNDCNGNQQILSCP